MSIGEDARQRSGGRTRVLTPVERSSLALGELLNSTPACKAIQDFYLRGVGYPWMRALSGGRLLAEGIDAFSMLDPDRGVLLVANHRSFFDFYAISVAMFGGPVPWLRRLHFPVRGEFYHSSIAGIALNLAAGLGVMYPPFFRERSKFAINRDGLGYLAARLAERGSIVGLHPEGGRSRDADPYRLQQLHPGAGELAVKAKPLVVPVFINGLTNSVGAEWQMSRDPDARSRTPLIVVFGEAIRPDGLPAQEPSARAYKLVADFLGERILALGRREQALRAACAAGNVPDDDKRWLTNRDGGRFYARR